MNVREIRLENLLSHADTTLRLPERGVTVVGGPNGAGKSSLMEAVATALWGKTLRGTPPWGAKKCAAGVEVAGGLMVRRTREGSRTGLAWHVDCDDSPEGLVLDALYRLQPEPGEWENTTKAQEALERLIGPFDVWRRSSAFSSADAAHFTLATDGERKRLLEAILGLERFDAALERCRVDLKRAAGEAATAQGKHSVAVAREDEAARALRLAEGERDAFGEAPPEPPPDKDTRAMGETAWRLQQSIGALRERQRDGDRTAGRLDADVATAERELARFEAGDCPACGRPFADEHRTAARARVDTLRADAAKARETAAAERERLAAEIADQEGELSELGRAQQEATAANRANAERRAARARHAQQRDRLEAAVTAAAERLATFRQAVEAAESDLSRAQHEAATLSAVESVLGLKGVRAGVLGRALSGLEAVSNGWLARLGLSGLKLTLKPYSEKKTGGVTDAISIDVEGAGGGHGYRASSGGERRRIDVALLFALAEVAAAAHGRPAGTLWFDEVFDCLDTDGVDAVAAALGELSAERAIVVITHNRELATRLPAVQRLHIEAGRVTC